MFITRFAAAAMIAVAAGVGLPAGAVAAPKNYCTELKGIETSGVCTIQLTDPGYTVDISFPTAYPDLKSVADYISKTRDGFLSTARSSAPRVLPYALSITAAKYGSAIPPRGTTGMVLTTYQNTGAAHPQTSYKSFNWDQTYRKPITWETLWQPTADPLPVVFRTVQADVNAQAGQPVPISPEAGLDPANYQNFAITNDGVIFFFSRGTLLPDAAGAPEVLVPRSAIDPMLA
ncbi:MAG: hypothetical protein QG655_2001 [Actinomycetota bacterium]|jgi:hypothetical protein|nr:hypothetical protein [Actinomycetota bacterium]